MIKKIFVDKIYKNNVMIMTRLNHDLSENVLSSTKLEIIYIFTCISMTLESFSFIGTENMARKYCDLNNNQSLLYVYFYQFKLYLDKSQLLDPFEPSSLELWHLQHSEVLGRCSEFWELQGKFLELQGKIYGQNLQFKYFDKVLSR